MITSLILSTIAGLADGVGGILSVGKQVDQKTLNYFISLSTGFILAVTILDLFPEVIRELPEGPVLILGGFVTIFILENFFAVHAHDGHKDHNHTLIGREWKGDRLEKHSVWAAYLGLLIHTFFDGAAIAARLMVSPLSGVLVFLAVFSHKVPEGFSMASIFQAGGLRRKTALLSSISLGLSTIIGALVVYLSGHSEFSLTFLALATGSFTYVAASELVPFVSGTKDRKGIILFMVGVFLFYLISRLLVQIGL